MIEAVFFDMDGTIIHTDHIWDAILGSFVGTENLGQFRRLRQEMSSRSHTAHCAVLRKHFNVTGTDSEIMERYAEKAASCVKNMETPFVDGFLKYCMKMPLKKALVTNAPSYVLEPLKKKLYLNQLFDGNIYNSDMVNAFKPDPAVVQYAIKQMNVKPENVLMFEDSVEGVVAAYRAGIRQIKIIQSDITFKNYKELL